MNIYDDQTDLVLDAWARQARRERWRRRLIAAMWLIPLVVGGLQAWLWLA